MIKAMEIIRKFEEQVHYYVMMSNELLIVNNKKDLLDLFPKQVPAAKTYIHQHNLRFKKHFESDLIELAGFFDRSE